MFTDLRSALHPALLVARREIRDQLRDWRIIFPIVGLTLFFPFLMNFTAQQLLGFVRQYGANIVGERLIPFLLMIVGFFPISVSLVIALESFVGEKERGSIEPLLTSPLKDWQLYVGKLVASVVPPLISSYLGMAVYTVGLLRAGIFSLSINTLLQVLALTTVQAVLMVSGAVVVSTQATSIRAANLLASFIVIPVALLIQAESVVMFWGQTDTLWWVVLGLAVLTGLLVRVGLAHFRREELLGREIDVLNLRWMARVFWRQFSGGAVGVSDWYRRVVPAAAKKLVLPALIVTGLVVAAFIIGAGEVRNFNIPFNETGLQNLRVGVLPDQLGSLTSGTVLGIWLQNLRALLISLVLGVFSLGILSVLPIMLTLGIAGYLMQLLAYNGVSPQVFMLGYILPHGIIEIPAAVLAVAAVLRMGALLATPDQERTVGEVWLAGLADWAKVMLAWVTPLLLIAAILETWVTPRIALWLSR